MDTRGRAIDLEGFKRERRRRSMALQKSCHRSVCTVLGLSSAADEGSLVGQLARSRACSNTMIDELLASHERAIEIRRAS